MPYIYAYIDPPNPPNVCIWQSHGVFGYTCLFHQATTSSMHFSIPIEICPSCSSRFFQFDPCSTPLGTKRKGQLKKLMTCSVVQQGSTVTQSQIRDPSLGYGVSWLEIHKANGTWQWRCFQVPATLRSGLQAPPCHVTMHVSK